MTNDWWRGATVYQIYPRSFQDHSGDGIGDLKGIIQRLPHVAGLGVDAIWLSPFFPSPMDDMGYDVSDYQDVDPMFGTLADFDDLIERAHELGLKVIIDQVISHSSSQHAWFEESRKSRTGPFADWYVWADPKPDGSPPNNWISVFGGSAWAWEPRRRQYYLHNFLDTQPDLNFHNPVVRDAIIETMRFWLERGVDGFRLDTVNYYFHDAELRDNPPLPPEDDLPPVNLYDMQDHIYSKSRPENVRFMEDLRALTDQYDDRAMVGEMGDRLRAIQMMGDYTAGGNRLHMAYSFDMLSPNFTPAYFREKIADFFEGAPDGWPSWSFSNHDVNRHVSRWEKYATSPEALAKLSIAMLAGFEGTIGIYQGEELGQLETDLQYHELTDPVGLRFWPENKGRDGCRTPMTWDGQAANAGFSDGTPWLPVKPPQAARNVAALEADPDSVLHHYRAVLGFRRSRPELLAGKTEFLDPGDPVLAFHRRLDRTVLTCVYNLSPGEVALSVTGAASKAGPDQRATLDGDRLTLGPNGHVFLISADPETAVNVALASKSAETKVEAGPLKAGTISG